MLFKQYTVSRVKKINHQDLIQECKYNTDKAYYEYKLQKGVYLTPLNREVYRSTNQEYCPKHMLE